MSTQLALGVVGAAIGAPFGMAQVGWTAGTLIGGLIDKPDGPSAGDLSAPQLQQGSVLPRCYGTTRVTVNPIWASDYTATANDAGGKGGPPDGSAGYTYTLDILGAIAHVTTVPIIAITRVWVNKKLVDTRLSTSSAESLAASAAPDAYTSLTLYPGGAGQTPPPTYETAVGAANASAYRNVATVEIVGLQCGSSQTPPLVEVEIITAGTQGATDALTLLQSRFIADADDESFYANGAPSVDGTPTIGGGSALFDYGAAELQRLRYPTINPNGVDAVTFEAIINWESTQNVTSTPAIEFTTNTALSGTTHIFTFYGDAGRLRYDLGGYGNVWDSGSPISYPVHIAYVVANSSTRLYVGGVLVHTGSGAIIGATHDMYVVAGDGTTSGPARFSVNGFRVRQEEVYTGSSFTPLTVIPPPDASITSWTPGSADLADIVEAELSLNPAITLADHDYSALVGTDVLGLKAAGPPAKSISELAAIFYFDLVPDAPLRYEPRGAAAVATILYADTGAAVDQHGKPFTGLKQNNDIEIPGVVGLAAPTIESDHEPVFERGDRLTTDGPDLEKRATNVVLTASQIKGRAIAASLMQRASAYTASFGLSDKYAVAQPGDSYTVTADDAATYALFILKLTYADGVRTCDWEMYDTTALVASGITDTNYTPSIVVAPGVDSNLVAIDGPILQDSDDNAGSYSAIEGVGDAAYPGGRVLRSVDDLDFSELAASHPTESVVGLTTGTLDAWSGGYVWDEVNSVVVTVGTGQTLSSATADAMQLDRMLNTAFIGQHGVWEVIRFRTATLGAVGVYTLTGLLRGCRGTEENMTAHAANDIFVLATTAGLRRMSGTVAEVGATRYLKAVTNGRSIAAVTSEVFVNDAVGLLPFSPSNLRASRDGSANITFTWDRRTRLQVRYGGPGGSFTPLGEGSERYEIDVYATSGYLTVLRTISATSETSSYTAAQQTTDFGSTQATVYVRVYQLSDEIGRGRLLQASA